MLSDIDVVVATAPISTPTVRRRGCSLKPLRPILASIRGHFCYISNGPSQRPGKKARETEENKTATTRDQWHTMGIARRGVARPLFLCTSDLDCSFRFAILSCCVSFISSFRHAFSLFFIHFFLAFFIYLFVSFFRAFFLSSFFPLTCTCASNIVPLLFPCLRFGACLCIRSCN